MKSISALLILFALISPTLADIECDNFVVRMLATRNEPVVGHVTDTLYTVFSPWNPLGNESQTRGLVYSNSFVDYRTGEMIDSIVVSHSIDSIGGVPFANSFSIALKEYGYIEVDSVLDCEITPIVQWVDSEVYETLTQNPVLHTFYIAMDDAGGCWFETWGIKVMSLDSTWDQNHFINQFPNLTITEKDQYDQLFEMVGYFTSNPIDRYNDVGNAYKGFHFDNFPESIRDAITEKKIHIIEWGE